jgi:3-oxoadipate enol-lactonase
VSTLAYSDTGTGLPVVLLHAFPFDRELWEPQRPALAGAGYRVILPDLPGFGQSPPGPEPLTVDGLADAVADLLTRLGVERAVVGGLSMGGYVALAVARRHPGRLAGLILADTKADPDDEVARRNRDQAIASVRAHGVAPFVQALLPKLLGPQALADPAVVEAVRGIATRQSAPALTATLAALRDRPDATPGLAAVSVPTLVVVGEDDAVTPPSAAEKLAAAIPGAELVRLPGAGHLANREAPEAFTTAVLAFLRRCR